MTKRKIYVALLIFIASGSVVDAVVWPYGPPSASLNDLVQGIGIMLLVYWWEIVDANELGQRRSSAARLLTILLTPLGHAIYLYQSRNWKPATALFLLYWAGILIVAIAVAVALGTA